MKRRGINAEQTNNADAALVTGSGRTLAADHRHLIVTSTDVMEPSVIDILINGFRVWSVSHPISNDDGQVKLSWPNALKPYLHGIADIVIRDSATQVEIAHNPSIQFGRSSDPVTIVDSQGRHLAMNKWARLGPSFEGDESGMQTRLLESGSRLIGDLHDLGYHPFIVGGTLLGAMRNGDLLGHDDDMDLAWICDGENPLDIAIASLRMERELASRGYISIRLGDAHVQITFFDEDGGTDHYIDIFTGFHLDGVYGQPFALRGYLSVDELLPVSTVRLRDIEYPAPAHPESWLEFAYGEDWLIPNPSFEFVTERSTSRRFENWFGVFNRGRVFWEKQYESKTPPAPSARSVATDFADLLPPDADVLDAGSGDGTLSQLMASRGHRVLGIDYSYSALRLARLTTGPARFRYLNLNNRRELLELAVDVIESGSTPYVCAIQLLAGVPKSGRENVYLFLRHVLTDQTFAYATFDTDLPAWFRRGDPTTWHYPLSVARAEAADAGLEMQVLSTGRRRTHVGKRKTATVIFSKSHSEGTETTE